MSDDHSIKSVSNLSQREIEILRLVATGATNQQIATQLDITLNTVKVHLRNIFAKLDVSSRTEASLYAVRVGLVKIESESSVIYKTDDVESINISSPYANGHIIDTDTSLSTESLQMSSSNPIDQRQPDALRSNSNLKLWLVLAIFMLLGLILIVVVPESFVELATLQRSTSLPMSPPETTAQDWNRRTPMTSLRTGFDLVAYNGRIYAVGGVTANGVTGLLECYNAQSDTWIQLSPKPTPVADMQAVVIGSKFYVAGGRLESGAVTNVLEVYNPEIDQWQSLVSLPEPRSNYAAANIDGKLYLFGGWDGSEYRAETWMFDPDTETWQAKAPMPQSRAQMSTNIISNRIHLIGGQDTSGFLSLHQSYEPFQDHEQGQPWRTWPKLPQVNEHITTVTILNNIYVFDPINRTLFIYDANTESWGAFETQLPSNIIYLKAVLLNTHMYLLGLTAPEQPFHIEYQILYQAQLPLITR